MPRSLFGPTTFAFARGPLAVPRAVGECLAFDPAGETDLRVGPNDSWATAAARFPQDWVPDLVVLTPAHGVTPRGLLAAPVPVVLVADDWAARWHLYRALAPQAELVIADEAGAAAFARAGCRRVRATDPAIREQASGAQFDRAWGRLLAGLDLDELRGRRAARPAAGVPLYRIRGCELLDAAARDDPNLSDTLWVAVHDPLPAATDEYLLGLLSPPAEASRLFARAVAAAPGWLPAGLALAEALFAAGKPAEAVAAARAALDRGDGEASRVWELAASSYPPRADRFRVEWERAGWQTAGDPDAEYRAKRELVRQRLRTRLAEWTGDPTAEVVQPPTAPTPIRRRRIVWEGDQAGTHSYGLVNRALCEALARRGNDVTVAPTGASVSSPGSADVWVRMTWPPVLTSPPAGRFVLIQPWEFGSLPAAWVAAINERVADNWAHSRAVRDCYLDSGIPADRVHVVPLGVDPDLFRPGAAPVPLPTRKRVKFLFVGGTIRRKGFDLLLEAYGRAFTAADDVCLVVKDVGTTTFYRGMTAGDRVAAFRARAGAPEVVYRTDDLPADRMPGLYAACDCLVLPFRGEGFGLPAVEAMACGRPVIATAASPVTDYCDPATGYLIPAARRPFTERRVGAWVTAGDPWEWAPDVAALAAALRAVADDPAGAADRGRAAADRIRTGWTWDHAARAVEARVDELIARPA